MVTDLVNKLKSNKGFTLIEALVSVVVCLIVFVTATVAIRTSIMSYNTIMVETQSETVMSSLTTIITDELRFAGSITSDADGNVTYFSNSRGQGERCTIKSVEVVRDEETGATGKQIAIVSEQNVTTYMLLSSSSYVYNIEADIDLQWNGTYFTVILTMTNAKGDQINKNEFHVYPVN